jgi:hypothetical protein
MVHVVFIEKTPDGSMMNEIRAWLDHRKIQPVLFRAADHGVGFELTFNNDDEAALFELEFPRFIRQADGQA